MQKIKLITNDRDEELRVCIEPLADEVFLKSGSSAKFVAEVADELSEFESEYDGDEMTVYLPAKFGRIFVSIDDGESIEL